jgi:hypothetical protein
MSEEAAVRAKENTRIEENRIPSFTIISLLEPALRQAVRGWRRVFVTAADELMQGEGDVVWIRCAPGNDALEPEGIVGDSADFHQLGFDDVRISHNNSSMAHVGGWNRRQAVPWLRSVSTSFATSLHGVAGALARAHKNHAGSAISRAGYPRRFL